MATAIILAGGSGTRMGNAGAPKQYLGLCGQPVFSHCLKTFDDHSEISAIVCVAAEMWRPMILEWAEKLGVKKLAGFADPGQTRQHSIFSALKEIKRRTPGEAYIILHDAARPLLTADVITRVLSGARDADGAMPYITVKDTVYRSTSGEYIESLLPRSELFSGQTPESFHFGKYYDVHDAAGDEKLGRMNGSSEIAFLGGMRIRLVEGSERNIKITTPEDLKTAEALLSGQ